jgi:hypothetical protein
MIDMTNNRVPYDLLTEEEKAALHEHKKADGEFLFKAPNRGLWQSVCGPWWCVDYVYRTVPLPEKTQDVIAWDRLPERIQWVAREEDEEVWAYEYEPHVELGWWSFDEGDAIRIDDFPGIVQIGTVDWKDSKQRRPRCLET